MEHDVPALQTVPVLDIGRYGGRWYEIARLPFRFEDNCVQDITATYTLRDNGEITVVNECKKANGEVKRAEGTARPAEKDGPTSKLQVTFTTGFLHFLPFVWADYWVIDLDPEYLWAVVSEPNRKYCWILSRKPQLDPAVYNGITARAAAQGIDVDRLVRTPQAG